MNFDVAPQPRRFKPVPGVCSCPVPGVCSDFKPVAVAMSGAAMAAVVDAVTPGCDKENVDAFVFWVAPADATCPESASAVKTRVEELDQAEQREVQKKCASASASPT